MVPGQPGEPEAALSDKTAWNLSPPGRPGTGKSSGWLAYPALPQASTFRPFSLILVCSSELNFHFVAHMFGIS